MMRLDGDHSPEDFEKARRMEDVSADRWHAEIGVLAVCPKCGVPVEDLDGFGVLVHDACGYCSHPDVYGGICQACGASVAAWEPKT